VGIIPPLKQMVNEFMNENQKIKFDYLPLSKFKKWKSNPKTHDLDAIIASIKEFDFRDPIAINQNNSEIEEGHGRVAALHQLKANNGPVPKFIIVTPDDWLVPVLKYDDSESLQHRYSLAHNRTTELGGYDLPKLTKTLQDIAEIDENLLNGTGYDTKYLNELLVKYGDPYLGKIDDDAIPDDVEKKCKPGDLWELGKHRLLCGDTTKEKDVQKLTGGIKIDAILTDPPYCSGGFQEAGKSAGSVGSNADHQHIINDRLSTRGYQALLKTSFGNIDANYLYCFTDWRMWVYLFDIYESSGFGVRSMIVWNKSYPGMGRGWRAQHELIMWGCKSTPPFDKHASGQGNVITVDRTGNINHTTEKPVELLLTLINNTPFIKTIADPFLGSGSTLIASEKTNRTCYAMEIDSGYCDVSINRWEEYAGLTAKKVK